MDHAEPGLFDLPESATAQQPQPQPPTRKPQRGRNRETWTCTVTADVSIIDAAAVTEALARYAANTVVIDANSGSAIEEPDLHDAGPDPTLPPFEQLPWLIDPTAGLETLREGGALRVDAVESAVAPESTSRGTATWTITAKLTDVQLLRRLATRAHSEDAELISDSLPLAWQRAADPFAPLRSIPGITWRPTTVTIEHLPARIARTL